MTPLLVPVHLGCCPPSNDGARCLLCAPRRLPEPATVAALVASYVADHPGRPVEIRFLGGAPPPDALIEAAGPHPFRARVRPDLLTRADAARLAAAGCVVVELDALTFHDEALRETRRPYRAARLREMSQSLPGYGLQVGGVLAPGLPASSFATCEADAAEVVGLGWSFVRLHPVLVVDGSALRELHAAGRYRPLELGEAVTVCRRMVDSLEAGGVEVIRVGLQPGPDEVGRVVAGPTHPGLRELVEARRTLDRLRSELDPAPRGAHVRVRCSPADLGRARGPLNTHIRTLRADLGLATLTIAPDPALSRGSLRVEFDTESA